MSHLRTHTSSATVPTTAAPTAVSASSLSTATVASDPTLAALQAAQAQAAGLFSPAAHHSALAALQAQAAKSSSSLLSSRFHPYGRPGVAVTSASAVPDHAYLNPAAVAYLGMPPMLYP